MRKAAVVVLALVAFTAAGSGDGDVLNLTSDDFDSTIQDNENVLVEFFAPWCGHCKHLAPEYAKAATTLKKDGIILAAVDATKEAALASKYGVQGYPTLKMFKGGKATEYKGGRTEDTIVSWVRKATGPAARELNSADDVEKFAEESKVAVVGFFSQDGPEKKAFLAVAKADDEHAYGISDEAEAAEANGVRAPAIVLFKKFDERKNIFAGDFEADDITEFVNGNSVPLITKFTMEEAQNIFRSPTKRAAFFFQDDDEHSAAYRAAAEKFKGKFAFVSDDGSTDRLNQHVGVNKANFPSLVIMTLDEQGKKFFYPEEEDFSEKKIERFLQDFLDGKLAPNYKSDPIPASNDEPVKVVVGKNFADIVLDPTKDVLLEVYAPWCGHCKHLAPVWDELGKAYAGHDSVVIAKMDGTSNEAEGLAVQGFPTLKFYPKGSDKEAEEYSGGRELKDFKAFLDGKTGGSSASGDDDKEEL